LERSGTFNSAASLCYSIEAVLGGRSKDILGQDVGQGARLGCGTGLKGNLRRWHVA
jgi:hypothetical protein